jgi:hypothetical protein
MNTIIKLREQKELLDIVFLIVLLILSFLLCLLLL